MAHILRARNRRTLLHIGREYGDGDRIVISKADMDRVLSQSKAFRFEDANDSAADGPPHESRRVTTPAS